MTDRRCTLAVTFTDGRAARHIPVSDPQAAVDLIERRYRGDTVASTVVRSFPAGEVITDLPEPSTPERHLLNLAGRTAPCPYCNACHRGTSHWTVGKSRGAAWLDQSGVRRTGVVVDEGAGWLLVEVDQ